MSAATRFWHMVTGWSMYRLPEQEPFDAEEVFCDFVPWMYEPVPVDAPVRDVYEGLVPAVPVRVTPTLIGKVWKGTNHGTPYDLITSATRRQTLTQLDAYGRLTLHREIPIPVQPWVQGWPNIDPQSDQHWLGLDITGRTLYETIGMRRNGSSGWICTRLTVWDLTEPYEHQSWAGKGVCAAGVAYLPLVVRADELLGGYIGHALAMTVPNYRNCIVEPAVSTDGAGDNYIQPPLPLCAGDRVVLSDSYLARMSDLGGHAATIAQAAHDHGVYLVDKSATPHIRLWVGADSRLAVTNFAQFSPSILDFGVVL